MVGGCLRRLDRTRRDLAETVGSQLGDGFALTARLLGQLGLSSTAPATSLRLDDDALSWHQVTVDGRAVAYGAGGYGPPVLFLHGWALGSRAYKRALRRLTARGTRVYAPAMPGFGGSSPMPLAAMTIPAYAEWASSFLHAVGVTEPALVIGHSFGGGVGTALAHAHPEQVRYLVLLNAVGGASWNRDRGASLSQRPILDWARSFGRDMLGVEGIEMLGAMSQDIVTNVLTNPAVLVRAGWLAKDADLTVELDELRTRDVPVLALTSERDDVIPSAAFETLCESVGAEGHVVRGGHSWLLADPDHFSDVVRNVVDVEVASHRAASAAAQADAVRELLAGTSIPAADVDRLVAGAPPLWLVSEGPAALASDLALCHPPLQDGEVRAVAVPVTDGPDLPVGEGGSIDDGTVRITVVAPDRPGLLADTAAALAEAGLSVVSASASTWPDGLAVHALVARPELSLVPTTGDDVDFELLGARLRDPASAPATALPFVPGGRVRVECNGDAADRASVTITARDRIGLLAAVCRWFADHDVTIETVHATTRGDVARDTFVVVGAFEPDALAEHLSTRRPRRPSLVAVGG